MEHKMHGPFEIRVINEPDYDAEPPDYCGEPEYRDADQKRIDAYNRHEWCYLLLGVELRVQNRHEWTVWTAVGRAYLSGVESDPGQSYIDSEIDNLTREAEQDAEATYQALKAIFEGK